MGERVLDYSDVPHPWRLGSPPPGEVSLGVEGAPSLWDAIEDLRTGEIVLLGFAYDDDDLPVIRAVMHMSTKGSILGAQISRSPAKAVEASLRARAWEARTKGLSRPPALLGSNDGSDEFYRRVAAQYLVLSRESSKPTTEMSKTSKVPLRTAQRWVTEARKRGLLPPGRKGRSG